MVSEKVLPSRYTLHASAVCFVSAAVVLAYFALVRGWPILLLGFLAVLISFFYVLSPVKYGFFSTALLPPLLTLSVDFVFTGRFALAAFLSGLPLLFSSAGVIYTYRVLYARPTSASSFSARLKLLVLLYCSVFLSIVLLDITGLIPSTTGIALLALPILLYLVGRSKEERLDYVPVTSLGVLLHAVTGLLIALGLVLS